MTPWLAALVLVPTATIIVVHRFNGLYGQDAYAYYQYAMGPLRDALRSLETPPPFFWPPGYPFLLSVTSFVLGTAPWVGQVVSLASAASVPIGVTLLARELTAPYAWPPFVPWMAGILSGVCGMLWRAGMVTMSDGAGIALAVFGAWAAVRYRTTIGTTPRKSGRWCMLAAILLAAATMTRLVYGLVSIPVAAYLSMSWFAHRDRAPRWPVAIAGVLFSLILAPVWAPMILDAVGNANPPFGGTFAVHHWNPFNAFRSTFDGVDGVRTYRFPNWFFYGSVFGREFYFTPLLAPFFLIGAWRAATRLNKHDAALLLGWPVLLFIFLVGDAYQNARFALAALPPMAVLVALGLQVIRTRLTSRWLRPFRVWVAIGIIGMAVGGSTHIGRILHQKNEDVDTVRWAQRQMPSTAQVLTFGLTQTWSFESQLPVFDLYTTSPSQLDTLIDRRTTYALFDVSNLVTQWKDYAPGNNYRWLENGYHLVPLGQRHRYTLFHVDVFQ